MHWPAIAIFTALAFAAQTVAAGHMEILGARPDFLSVLLVTTAFFAPLDRAALVGWMVGLCAEPLTVGPTGLTTATYGTATMALALLRDSLFRTRVLTQFAAAFVVCAVVRSAWLAVDRWSLGGDAPLAARFSIDVIGSAAYTAALCPVFAQPFLLSNRASRLLRAATGVPGPRALGAADV